MSGLQDRLKQINDEIEKWSELKIAPSWQTQAQREAARQERISNLERLQREKQTIGQQPQSYQGTSGWRDNRSLPPQHQYSPENITRKLEEARKQYQDYFNNVSEHDETDSRDTAGLKTSREIKDFVTSVKFNRNKP